MIFRVSDLQTFSRLSTNFGRLRTRVEELNEQATTGLRLNRPSDDPAGAGVVVRSLSVVESLAQDTRAVNFARSFLTAQDGVLEDAGNVITRAREIAVQHSNDLFSDSERAAAAAEVHALLEALVALGNAELGGRRLFSAGEDATGAAPFTDPNDPAFDPANPYNGSATPLEVEIGSGELIRTTTPGDQVLGSAIVALADLETQLSSGADPGASLPLLEGAAGDLSVERSSIGTRAERLDGRAGQIEHGELAAQDLISTTRDADIVAVVTSLVSLQGQLQVAAAASQQVLQASLVNLLRV
jgi:flagellar hook-associated protein 3 FlgL